MKNVFIYVKTSTLNFMMAKLYSDVARHVSALTAPSSRAGFKLTVSFNKSDTTM
jgi:hypothetical protein